MKRFSVRIPPLVEEKIRAQVLYIAHDSIDNALEWEDRLRVAVGRLGEMPGACAVDEDATLRMGEEIRKLVFERTYLLFYRINLRDRRVELVNFRHGARLPRASEA